jgi:beta-fructofuranosidase
MYHGTVVGNMVAVSSDPLLLNWEKVSGKAVIPAKHADGTTPVYRVFDPCIWKKDGLSVWLINILDLNKQLFRITCS